VCAVAHTAVVEVEGDEVAVVSVLTDSRIAVDPEACMTDRDVERDTERDAELEWGVMRDSFAEIDEACVRGLERILPLIDG
jgi:hypothetical protein